MFCNDLNCLQAVLAIIYRQADGPMTKADFTNQINTFKKSDNIKITI